MRIAKNANRVYASPLTPSSSTLITVERCDVFLPLTKIGKTPAGACRTAPEGLRDSCLNSRIETLQQLMGVSPRPLSPLDLSRHTTIGAREAKRELECVLRLVLPPGEGCGVGTDPGNDPNSPAQECSRSLALLCLRLLSRAPKQLQTQQGLLGYSITQQRGASFRVYETATGHVEIMALTGSFKKDGEGRPGRRATHRRPHHDQQEGHQFREGQGGRGWEEEEGERGEGAG